MMVWIAFQSRLPAICHASDFWKKPKPAVLCVAKKNGPLENVYFSLAILN